MSASNPRLVSQNTFQQLRKHHLSKWNRLKLSKNEHIVSKKEMESNTLKISIN